ncbi:MAG: hypothetical protein ACI4L9_06230 [Candidatus Coproplasma sp.]
MSKNYRAKRAKFKAAAYSLATIATSCMMFAACAAQPSDTDEEKTNTKIDTQLLKNGNFEFFNDNDGVYLISSPDNWTSGSSSDSMSGVIGTSHKKWAEITDTSLPQKLWDNDELEDDDEDKVDYNGLMPDDLPFKNTHDAIKKDTEDADGDGSKTDYIITEDAEYIANPFTRNYSWDEDGNLLDNQGAKVATYEDEDGNLFLDEALTKPVESNVLMIHNYVDDDNYGAEKYYSSSQSLTLEANTAAKISVWVKTCDLYFGSNDGTRTPIEDQRGAYITVDQTVGGNSVDSFKIKNINTEKLNPDGENNGWVEYTVYVRACDYAETTVSITVGLGEESDYTVEGYAFFDDLSFTKYLNYEEMLADVEGGEDAFNEQVKDTTCTLLDGGNDKIFRVDKEIFNKTENTAGTIVPHYSGYNQYLIDLTSNEDKKSIVFADTVSMGLYVDGDKYVSGKGTSTPINANLLDNGAANAYLPRELQNGMDVSSDVLANLTVTSAADWSSSIGGRYQTIIDDALKSAASLPGVGDGETQALLILSAQGAAYEAVIADSSFELAPNSYKIISFWIKTSDMNGNPAATVTLREKDNNDNYSSFSVDSTTLDTVTINDVKDVYSGWAQCFVLVANEDETNSRTFEISLRFGPETIKDTTASSYYGGWAALTNFSMIDVDKDAFGYAQSGSRSASLTLTEENAATGNYFDDTFGNSDSIENDVTRPANYNGVNGGSASIKNTVSEITDYDQLNDNPNAGLINKEYFENYKNSTTISSSLKALFEDKTWKDFVGDSSTQPLLIVNTVRQIGDESGIFNYGYIGKDSTYSADGYTATSVKVKVSAGAIAKVYLVSTDDKNTLTFDFPEYTFWYDDEGNVLKGEPAEDATEAEQKANIAYTLRGDGLHEDAEGKLYANLYNLSKYYQDERADYYDAEGNKVQFDRLESGETYYCDAQKSAYAPHYLVTGDGTKVYKYLTENKAYYYMVDGVADTTKQVNAFDTSVAQLRYENVEQEQLPYCFTIDTIANPELADKWITVNFLVKTGNLSKNYRLELWSGSRDEKQSFSVNSNGEEQGVVENSYVMFDYSSLSLDESTFNDLISHYTDEIITAYKANLIESNVQFDSNNENIAYFEGLTDKLNTFNYSAKYYTFTLYDSSNYVPFNGDIAEDDETGYDYNYSDYEEQLAFLKIEDLLNDNGDVKNSPVMNMFIDYSATDRDIAIGSASDVEEEETEDTTTSDVNVWLLASSIALVAAILLAIIAIIVKDFLKKRKKKSTSGKNSYNYAKNKRYVRKYVKANGEAPVQPENDQTTAQAENGEAPAQPENAETEKTEDTQVNGENTDKTDGE